MLSRSAAAAPVKRRAPARVLPGFKITLGYTLMYLCLIVLIPLSALVFKTFTLTWDQFWDAVTGPRVMASYRLTFGASLIAALINVVFGLLVAWVLVRYQFFGKKIVDALVDLPFALPTAVAGISLTALLAGNGWVGQYLEPMGIQLAFNANGIVIALIFIGLPFVVRTVQPVLEDAEKELEEATSLELPMLSKNLVIVSTCASIGTLIGLIGTVFGMIRAFAALANSGAPDTAALATGISEALVNTAFGIIGSTLAIISYNYFTNRIDGMTHSMDEAGYSIVSNFQANHG